MTVFIVVFLVVGLVKFLVFVSEVVWIFSQILTWTFGEQKDTFAPPNSIILGAKTVRLPPVLKFLFISPCFSTVVLTYFVEFTCFCMLYVYFASPYFYHDAFMHHAMHVLDAPDDEGGLQQVIEESRTTWRIATLDVRNCLIVIVISRFLQHPQKLVHRRLSKTKLTGSGSDPESQAGLGRQNTKEET